jgi:2OG-Fe(II) oxygenase superfamily
MADGLLPVGFAVIDDFADRRACAELVQSVNDYRDRHHPPYVTRHAHGRDLRYQVIDGARVTDAFPSVRQLLARMDRAVASVCAPRLARLGGQVGVNINITPPGGSYRWHYDRCPVTAMIYLNAVSGGEIDLYPGYRLPCGPFAGTTLQRYVDAIGASPAARWLARGRHVALSPCPGRLLVIRGDRCLHSVREVGDGPDRINLVVSYTAPGTEQALPDLDTYLYSDSPVCRPDPNYRQLRR